jgi:hypothetical protein
MFGFQFSGLGFRVMRTAALNVGQTSHTWLLPSLSPLGWVVVRLPGDQFIPAHGEKEFQPYQPLDPVMPEALSIIPGLSPALCSVVFRDPVEHCPDVDRSMHSNQCKDLFVHIVEPGHWPWLGWRREDLLGVFGCHDFGNHLRYLRV